MNLWDRHREHTCEPECRYCKAEAALGWKKLKEALQSLKGKA